jgi:hypothetical protein
VPTNFAVSRTSRRRSIAGREGICGRLQMFDGGRGLTQAARPGGVRGVETRPDLSASMSMYLRDVT